MAQFWLISGSYIEGFQVPWGFFIRMYHSPTSVWNWTFIDITIIIVYMAGNTRKANGLRNMG